MGMNAIFNNKRIFHYIGFCSFLIVVLHFPLHAQQAQDQIYLSMEEAISRALTYNNQMRAGEFAVKKANWDKKHAWTLLMPTVSLNSRYTWIDDSTFALRDFSRYFQDPDSPFQIPQTVFQKSYYTSVDLSVPLFNGALLNGLFIANANEDAARQMSESTRNNILFQVISGYLNVIYSKEILNHQQDYLELSRLNYKKAERMHEAGRYSKTETLRWKIDYQQQKSTVGSSESRLRSSNIILGRILSLDMNKQIKTEERIPQNLLDESNKMKNLSDSDILRMIQLNNEELIKANSALSAAKSNEKISKLLYRNSYSSYLPNVSLSYSYAWRENNTLALDGYSPKTLMVNFSLPLFTGFQNFTSVKSSYYDYKQNQEQFADQLQNTRFILTETANKIINLKSQIELSETNVEFNERNYNIVEQQKEKGLISNLDFIDAKLNLQNAKLSGIRNQYDFISAIVELYYLTGQLDSIVE